MSEKSETTEETAYVRDGVGSDGCSCESDVLRDGGAAAVEEWSIKNRMEHDPMGLAGSREVMKSERGEDVATEGRTGGVGVHEPRVHAHGGDADLVGVKTARYHEREVHRDVLLVPCVPVLDNAVEPIGEKMA